MICTDYITGISRPELFFSTPMKNLENFSQKYGFQSDEDDDGLVFHIPFNIIYVISRQWVIMKGLLYAMMCYTVMS